ncbi:UDP-4-amino-4,6-dideoxy-N-acetyl-beta-L-altrosamine transaminase [Acidovorax sp. GW101-3H11]|uniref:UDP-4-amino-4, 6-dideoxy-N-acetyl-beta-L-altrosamine transaminase n=1 Tax=Acidovorax sp. GW101-3H11 TaxID=1813946 RepID=UPI0007B542D1|nr:UDP-4-amino-4,6-dideoxy-N-acetyl-beta-L-altrosamine transaminase [Acidovorax sp. GW101-3H11]KZT15183.1 UDP-4-amino-4,6-dideoxy-N-acetyl-beta-L-altrosamine transaminase [Acidovorax sp. GW101-3H11]
MYIPYSCQQITEEDIAAVVAILKSEYLTQGPSVTAFETAFAVRHEVAHAVAVSNATAALHIGCLALGVGPGSLVWTTPNTFLASANCALYCGADIDFVDMDGATRNISVAALTAKLKKAEANGRLPSLLIPVDFSGLPCDMREIRALADCYGFRILEDASHAAGASYLGRPVGSAWADLTVFSFHAVKIVTTAEGGIVTTQDDAIAAKLRLLRSHGMTRDPAQMDHAPEGAWYYEQQQLGFNYRLTDLQAALGASQLKRIDTLQVERVKLASRYDKLLAELPLHLPPRLVDRESAWHLYTVEIDPLRTRAHRATVFARLREDGVGVNVHYIPVHLQPYYARLGFRLGEFPAAEKYYANTLSLPLFPAMTQAQQDHVVGSLTMALREAE